MQAYESALAIGLSIFLAALIRELWALRRKKQVNQRQRAAGTDTTAR